LAESGEPPSGHRDPAGFAAQPPDGPELELGSAVEASAADDEVGTVGRGAQWTGQLVLQVLHCLGLAAQGVLQDLARLLQLLVEAELVGDDLTRLGGVGRQLRGWPGGLEDAIYPVADADRRAQQPPDVLSRLLAGQLIWVGCPRLTGGAEYMLGARRAGTGGGRRRALSDAAYGYE